MSVHAPVSSAPSIDLCGKAVRPMSRAGGDEVSAATSTVALGHLFRSPGSNLCLDLIAFDG